MDMIEYRFVTAFLAMAIGFAPVGYAGAADVKKKTESKTGLVRAKSPLSAELPSLARVVVTPSPEQIAAFRLERRMMKLANQASDVRSAETHVPR